MAQAQIKPLRLSYPTPIDLKIPELYHLALMIDLATIYAI